MFIGSDFFDCTNSVFNITDGNNSFALSILGRWRVPNYLEDGVILKLIELVDLREQDDIKLHVEEFRKRGNHIKIVNKEYKLSDLGIQKNEIIEDLKNISYSDLQDMVFRLALSHTEISNIFDMKYIDASPTGYTLKPGVYKVSDINSIIKSLVPNDVKVNFTNDDIRLRSNSTNNKTIKFTIKSFFFTAN